MDKAKENLKSKTELKHFSPLIDATILRVSALTFLILSFFTCNVGVCISYLLLCNKPPQTQWLKTTA